MLSDVEVSRYEVVADAYGSQHKVVERPSGAIYAHCPAPESARKAAKIARALNYGARVYGDHYVQAVSVDEVGTGDVVAVLPGKIAGRISNSEA